MAKHHRRAALLSLPLAFITTLGSPLHAAPTGAHPRLWLDAETKAGLADQASDPQSPVARGAARCSAAREDPSEYDVGGWQGFEFVLTLSGCLVSWAATGDSDDLSTAIKYWNVLLDDYSVVGDGAGGDDVVTHDTGYAMRTFAPYSAIAYDWLHDAPGVTETLRAHARDRFDAWVTYYTDSGYLRHMPGANYEAGYAFAATLIAIAEAGEAGAKGDAHWTNVHDVIWGEDLAPAFAAGGVLEGGDWPEGWQYGPLSVTEHALAARAMQDNGSPIAGADAWASSLVTRFLFGLTPVTKQAYPAGDSDNDTPQREPENGALVAAIAGPAGSEAKAWARWLGGTLDLENENALFDALAVARSGPSTEPPKSLPLNHLAAGSGNWYVRSSWDEASIWSVFQCSRRLVDDHQHNDAGNFVLTRGADDLVVDPSPYGTLSTLTGNAPAVDSSSLPDGYSPSQGNWGQSTRLAWARQSSSGVAAGRCDYADQFRLEDYPSDVTVALRDYVLVPDGSDGEIVLVDRVVTGDASRGLHLRVRTPGDLSLSGGRAVATVGDSSLSVERVWSSTGSGSVRTMPQASECPSSDHTCDVSRIPSGTEYRLDIAGPEAAAIHVVSARSGGQAPGAHEQLSGDGYRGVVVARAGSPVAIIASTKPDGNVATALEYRAPAGGVHVVLDAPAGDAGLSDVVATRDGSSCVVSVSARAASSGGYPARPLVIALDDDCAVRDDGNATDPGAMGPGSMDPPTKGEGGEAGDGSSRPTGDGGTGDGGQADPSGGTPASSGGSGGAPVVSSGGSSPLAAGGASATGGVQSGLGGAVSAQTIPPVTPEMSGCSVLPNGHEPRSSVSLAALLGLGLLSGRRRRVARR